MEKHEYLKKLSKEEREIQNELKEIGQKMLDLSNRRNVLNNDLKQTQVRISILKQDQPHVTDHAIFRFIQRVQGTDTDQLKKEIVTPLALSLLDQMGWTDGKYPSGNGYSLVVKDGTIITIIA